MKSLIYLLSFSMISAILAALLGRHWHSVSRRIRQCSCQLLQPTTHWSNPLHWFHYDSLPAILGCHPKIGQEPGDQRQGYHWRWEEERERTVEEDRERETDGVMGRERVLQAERKGSPTDLTVLICRICKEKGGATAI